MRKLTTEDFISRCKILHNNKYDYSKVRYTGSHNRVIIICREHGQFTQVAAKHLRGHGCNLCARSSTTEYFVSKSKNIHGDKYLYDKVKYKHHSKKVLIGCRKHGYFLQRPNDHLSGKGCSVCNKSRGENSVAVFLTRLGIPFIREWWDNGCRNKRPLPFDFFLPGRNILIEYDGEQHYNPVNRFWGKSAFKRTKENDKIKTDWCLEKGYKLIRIPYYENVEDYLRKCF